MIRIGRLFCALVVCIGCDDAARTAPSPPAAPQNPRVFADVTRTLGIDFHCPRPARPDDYFMPDSMGPGCALFDFDGDGRLDIYLVNGFRDPVSGVTGPAGRNRLYLQQSDGNFLDVTSSSGADHEGYGMGVAIADIDNDGDIDIYLTNYGADALLRNDGDGTFQDVTAAAGLGSTAWGASAAFFDYDGDGYLDLFVTNYVAYDPKIKGADTAGRPEYPPPSMFPGVPDLLYHNDGDGTFTNVSGVMGIAAHPGAGLGVAILDLDEDGRLDVYVANDGELNFAWVHGEDGRFTEDALHMGLAANSFGEAEASMGIAVGDVDGDADFDLLLTHLVQQSNTLYRNDPGARFTDNTLACGLSLPSIDFTGFGTAFLDVENDGDLDLLCANGRVLRRLTHERARLGQHWNPYAEPDQLFLNDGSGNFSESAADDFSDVIEVSRGLACGDFDGDGGVDVLVTYGNGTARLFRNRVESRGHWVTVRALDGKLGRDAIGAVVDVTSGQKSQRRIVTSTGGYLCAQQPVCHFGLAAVGSVDEIRVTWPDGQRETFPGGRGDRVITVIKGAGQ